MDRPKLSIITPVLNGEKFMEECIKNVIHQKCPFIEHVIVDGGSIDGTVDVIKQYAEQYKHIRWNSEKDKGQSDAQNKGIMMSKGEIISFLNVDDYYEPGVFMRILEIFKTLPEPSLLVGNCNVWDHDGSLREICKPKKLKITDLLMGYAINPHPVNPTSYFYHRSLHDIVGLYDNDIWCNADQDFVFAPFEVHRCNLTID